MSDVQIAIIDQENIEVNLAVPGIQGAKGDTGTVGVAADGTAAAPGISFASDTDTGIYRVGSNSIGISTGGTGRLFVDASGNVTIDTNTFYLDATNNRVGIGTTSPGVSLDVSNSGLAQIRATTTDTSGLAIGGFEGTYTGGGGGTASSVLLRAGDGYTLIGSSTNTPLLFITNNSEKARILSSGNFGIGTTSPGQLLAIATATNDDGIILTNSSANGGRIRINSTGTGGRQYHINVTANGSGAGGGKFVIRDNTASDAARLTIDSSGNVGIGTTSPGEQLSIGGAANVYASLLSSGGIKTAVNASDATGCGAVSTVTNHPLRLETNNTERARIDTSGRLLVGTSSAYGSATLLELHSSTQFGPQLLQRSKAADAFPTYFIGQKIRNTSIVQSGDGLASFVGEGYDGASYIAAARVDFAVDGTPGSTAMPGRLVFSTNSGTAGASPTEKMRIDSKGFAKFSNTGSYVGIDCYQYRADTNEINTFIHSTNAAYTNNILQVRATKAGSNDFALAYFASNNGADIEFNLRGDGNAFADGSWTGGGADYAEYFEWSDENPDAEDRRGVSVVLDGNNIRPALAGEDPIGVISGNPSVVGDAAWNKWNGKYLRDDYGTYIQEDYEVEDEDGNTVIQQRRKLNPAYDPDQEYISREQRPEWDCVGLMGKLRIRKGQPTGSRWIKMRDISDSVEEWLVR